MDISNVSAKIFELLIVYGMKVIAAIIIFIIGRWVAKGITNFIKKLMNKSRTDQTLINFIGHLSYVTLLAFVIIAALNQLGIQTASFIAIIGAAGLAIGLALQGSLSNFAAGVLMIIFKPFKSGDYIEGAGVAGTVEEINIFTTQLKTSDNKTIIIPNSKLMGDNITNYTMKGTRRVDMVFGIGYEDDIDKARDIIQDIIIQDKRVLKEPKSMVAVSELAESSVNFIARAWTLTNDYSSFYFDTLEAVKKRFDAEGISIPFPQRDVHVYEKKSPKKKADA
jgi:small conductance mechanosensitive channel